MKSWLSGKEPYSFGWADLVVVPLIAILSVPALMFFGRNWTVVGNDSARYLLAGWQFISGQPFQGMDHLSEYNGGHGPVLPALIGLLIIVFGNDPEPLAWASRLMALINPLLAYFLVKRISGPVAGLIAAMLVSLFGFTVDSPLAIIIDPPMLTFYLLSLLSFLAAMERNSSPLAFLSGALLALSMLTKEATVASIPLALGAVLLLDWELRGALWHYLGLVLVSLPWWIWAYSATGEVYLMDRLPAQFRIPVLIGAVIFVILAALAYVSGIVDRFLADERRRRWTGWSLVLAWTVSLTGMLLATAPHALAGLSFEALKPFLANLLEPTIVVVPTLLVVVGYVAWKALRQNRGWRLLALAMLFQVPVCLLVTVERWAPRQFLILQTLVFCALAALVVEAGVAALRERDYSARLIGTVVAVPLATLIVVGSVEKIQALRADVLSGKHTVEYPETQMADWMAQNVPEGEHVLVVAEPVINGAAINVARTNYLIFLDGGRHELTQLQLDQSACYATPNVPVKCDPEKTSISRIPPSAFWLETSGRCHVISLSMSNLSKQTRQSNADYVMISGSHAFPGVLQLPPILQRSNAFEVAHVETGRRSSTNRAVVLLKTTGREPKTLPTQMTMKALLNLTRCEQAMGPGYSERMESTFPNGIVTLSRSSLRNR